MIGKLLRELFSKTKRITKQRDFERERFYKSAKEQFTRLRRMGIGIPVMSR